jgi:ribosomal protein S18 acetylase RimI-like enzyme
MLLTDGHAVAYLVLLVVAADRRRQRIGNELISALYERSGLSRIDLLSEPDSVAFYESFPHKAKPGFRLYAS